jgi:hypothetical protein
LFTSNLCPGGTSNLFNLYHSIAVVDRSSNAGAELHRYFILALLAQCSQPMLFRLSRHTLFLFFLQLVLVSLSPAAHAAPFAGRRYETTPVRRHSSKKLSQDITITTIQHTDTYVQSSIYTMTF